MLCRVSKAARVSARCRRSLWRLPQALMVGRPAAVVQAKHGVAACGDGKASAWNDASAGALLIFTCSSESSLQRAWGGRGREVG